MCSVKNCYTHLHDKPTNAHLKVCSITYCNFSLTFMLIHNSN